MKKYKRLGLEEREEISRMLAQIGALVERATRATILIPVKNKSAEEAAKAFAKEVKKLPQRMKLSMTYDSGARNGRP